VCFAPGVVVEFNIEEVNVSSAAHLSSCAAILYHFVFNWAQALALQWDSSKPSTIGSPLRIGSHPHCQEFDELAEVMDVLLTCLTATLNYESYQSQKFRCMIVIEPHSVAAD
jgi:hypothetical protein